MAKVLRKIIKINEEKCDGCGLCIPSCAEGALQVIGGKARLINERFCDGLGNCLGECPRGAIEIIEREAEQFDEEAVKEHLQTLQQDEAPLPACGCAGSAEQNLKEDLNRLQPQNSAGGKEVAAPEPELSHWPIQLHLVNPQARFLRDCDLLIAADCVPFAFADFHRKLLKGKSLLIGCPKLDDTGAYHDRLVEIFKQNRINSITLAHMEVGCCFGLRRLVHAALKEAGREEIPVTEVVIGVDGTLRQ